MGGVVLLTGGTGFLGSQVVRNIVKETDHTVVALVRARDAEEARQRLERAWSDWPEAVQAIGGRVEPLPGDLVLPGLGITGEAWTELSHRVTHIVHSAAELRFDGALDEMRRINVEGVRHLLEFARSAHEHHGLARYAHVSTAYVAGRRTGPVPEDALSAAAGFSSAYEQAKYEGERLVQAASLSTYGSEGVGADGHGVGRPHHPGERVGEVDELVAGSLHRGGGTSLDGGERFRGGRRDRRLGHEGPPSVPRRG